ncbi:MAG: hypothetical protein ACHQ5A_14995, partial [Opitutales bacterium]
PYGLILALWTLWELRGQPTLALRAGGGLLGAFLLFGSVETYVESARLYGYPFGPPQLLYRMGNHDGVRGGLANLTRHVAGGIYAGPTTFRDGQRAVTLLVGAERTLLSWTGLTDAGTDPRFRDQTLFFHQSGLEELSGFGPIGTLAMATMLFACLRWRPRACWWRLASAAFLGLVLTSLAVSYTCWTSRYLISWYALGTIAFVCALWEREFSLSPVLRWVYVTVALVGVVAAPFNSFNRGPAGILASLCDRDRFETSTYPLIGKVRERLHHLHAESPHGWVYLVVNDESVALPLLEDKALDVIMVTQPVFTRLVAKDQLVAGDLVARESRTNSPALTLVEVVSAPDIYSDNQTRTQYIYRAAGPSPGNKTPLRP